jgi:TetR/AcrR family transcriptional regulator
MTEPGSHAGRTRDAHRSRAAILDAAEAVFAQHGFDGARIDVIANASGYNNGLLFRYFGDKLGLYTEVLKRADREMSELLARAFTPLLADETIVSDTQRWKGFLITTFGAFFDYMVEHPRVMRIFNWEQAEGWQTFTKIASQFEPNDLARLEELFSKARRAGLLRPDLDVVVMVMLIEQICWSSPAAQPLYQSLYANRNLSSDTILAHIREQIIAFLVAGVIHDAGNENVRAER